MNNDISATIDALYQNKITYEEALKYINNYKLKKKVVKAKKLKIMVNDKENNKKINLPKLSLSFVKRISTFCIRIAKKYSKEIPENFSKEDVNELIDILMNQPPFTMVEIKSLEADVLIYTC